MSLDNKWNEAKNILKRDLGDTLYSRWIEPINVCQQVQDTILMAVPTNFMKTWIVSNYIDNIVSSWKDIDDSVVNIDFMVMDDFKSADNTESKEEVVEEKETIKFDISLDESLKFENFVVGKTNEFAYSAAKRIANSDKVDFNPLFLYGGVGLGKTHLMNAIAWEIKEKFPKKKIAYMSAENFMYQFINALRGNNAMDFKNNFRSVDVLMIDDIQFICGKDSTQEEFFHTFNSLVDQNKQIIISADKSPSDLEGMELRLKTRLGWGLVADIHPTTYELRLGILQSKLEGFSIPVPDDVLDFLADNITSNVRELEGALNRVVAHSELVGRPVTIASSKELLSDILRSNSQKVTVEEIQKAVSNHYNIKNSEMQSDRRSRNVARPRQVAMYLSKQMTSYSLPEIGRKFGGRDHTTVMHAIKTINNLKVENASIKEDIEIITRNLG
ncbi:MAG: chromosomal replication initiator protein DnaA [Alphaproteobacteria bacterium]|jgi:chromosomal replication initiator protein|nr:chromosomal replication initiator protein DnaA [Alphaproteobacteria bacterium]MCV6599177.1 chromosomal replication initiator protein DnaA [Alphaproteobacteria bacterium]